MSQIVLNKVKCLECGEELISYHRHDYRTCNCPNHTSIDGGLDYLRYGGVDMEKVRPMVVYLDDDFDTVREAFHWGTYGKSGKDELKYVPMNTMSNAHIQKILAIMIAQLPKWVEQLFVQELTHRKHHKIYIKDGEV